MRNRLIAILLSIVLIIGMVPIIAAEKSNLASTIPSVKSVHEYGVQIGEYITLGSYYGEPIVWRCVAIDDNGPLMLSDRVLCLKAYDAKGNSNTHYVPGAYSTIRKSYGSNCWADSNLREWLNSAEFTVAWSHDQPTANNIYKGYNAYASEAGFLTNFTEEEKKCIKKITHKVFTNEAEKQRGVTDGGTTEYILRDGSVYDQSLDLSQAYYQNVEDFFFLLDILQMRELCDNVGEEYLMAYPTKQAVLNSNFTNRNFNENIPCPYWINHAGNNGHSYEHMFTIHADGRIGGTNIWYSNHIGAYEGDIGVRPAFYLNNDYIEIYLADKIIRRISPEEIIINGSGTATAYFQLQDKNSSNVVEQPITYFVQTKEYHTVTDGNGVFAVNLPEKTGTYDVQFTLDGVDEQVYGVTQTVAVKVAELSYTQSWFGVLGSAVEASIGPSAGASVGIAKFEATAAKAAAELGNHLQYELKDIYSDGNRTLEMSVRGGPSLNLQLKSGVEATSPSVTVRAAGLSAGAEFMQQSEVGLKIKNYDPANMEQVMALGAFQLQTALLGSGSVLTNTFLEKLGYNAHNQSAILNIASLEEGAELGVLEVDNGTIVSLVGGDAQTVFTGREASNFVDNTRTHSLEITAEAGAGILGGTSSLTGVSGYLYGFKNSNSLKAEAQFNSDNAPQSLEYTLYDNGKGDIGWYQQEYESITKLTYSGDEIPKIMKANEAIRRFLAQEGLFLSKLQLVTSLSSLVSEDFVGIIEHEQAQKSGMEIKIPISLEFGVGLGINFNGAIVDEIQYQSSNGVLFRGTEYLTSESDKTIEQISTNAKTLEQIIAEPLSTAIKSLASMIENVIGSVVEGIQNGLAALKGTAEKWIAVISTITSDTPQSFAILTLQSENEPDSNAAVSVTVGDPYVISVYSDEEKGKLVSDDDLTENPLMLTLAYTPELLTEAGATADATLNIYRFDTSRNTYILVPNCVQNREEMTVQAEITHQGEYILATDSASPLISDFALSDQTPTPTLTVLASDMSGFKEFRFWIDDGEDLVTIDNMDAHYDAATGMFTYRFTEALAGGTHTAYFQAMDKLENANQEPFAFTFTIDAAPPEIATVTVPEGTATDALGFQVTAQVSDDAALSQVMLNATLPDGKTLHLTMEEQEDGSFAATVAPLSGAGTVTLQVVAVDQAGNRTQSADYTVPISIPAEKTGLYLEANRTGTALAVTVHNAQPKALGAWLVAAAYDTRGAMVDLQSSYVGLTGNASKTYDLSFVCGAEKIASATAFLVDVSNGYVPLAAERIL